MLIPHQVCMSCWYHIRCTCYVGTTSGVEHMQELNVEGTAIYDIGTLNLVTICNQCSRVYIEFTFTALIALRLS